MQPQILNTKRKWESAWLLVLINSNNMCHSSKLFPHACSCVGLVNVMTIMKVILDVEAEYHVNMSNLAWSARSTSVPLPQLAKHCQIELCSWVWIQSWFWWEQQIVSRMQLFGSLHRHKLLACEVELSTLSEG